MELETFFSMFQRCFGYWTSRNDGVSGNTFVKEPQLPSVTLDTYRMGNDVVIVKNGHRICGSGGALASAPIHQDKAYFEVKIQQASPEFGVGLATSRVDLNHLPLGSDSESWILRADGGIFHGGKKLYQLPDTIALTEGDIIGIAFDHISLKFFINNQEVDYPVRGIRGGDDGVYPLLYVDDGSILDASFTHFHFQPPPGFDRILIEQSLL